MKKSNTHLEAPRSGFYFAPGAVESSKARRKWVPILREWAICLAIAAAAGMLSAFINSKI